ncbi:transcriptional regulator, LysR family [Methylobacterium sp. 4-46]|uniref:LysR family transcriptional regulator n=1 Tax=unclassified Methylobacterium TaxID=2615210 RepID=UPI000165C5F4|nr:MULTISPECIES: LysR family transcriptional regulator [Methylobacterium]ACA17387.1 transcriptional regulator, LysR family [Methylobacterium sp. 4-46]WFT83074.1 LysR family transcriptional regulator [Methylobacterium nodulans]
MQTSSLRYFLAVARTGSIAAASAQLNVAASAISRQIANLEAELDCVLFERRPRGMVPSPAGELLAQHAHQVLMRTEQVVTEIRDLQGLVRGLIRVASSEGFALDILPNAIAAFHGSHPGIRFELTILPPAQVTQVVAAGDADIGMTFAMDAVPPVRVVYDARVEMIVVAAPGHPLAGAPLLRLADLTAHPVALPTRDTTARRTFDAACAAEGVAIEPTLTANHLWALLPFVRRTRGVAVMSALSVETPLRLGELAAVPIRTQGGLMRGIQMQTMRDRRLPRAVGAFLRSLLAALPPA